MRLTYLVVLLSFLVPSCDGHKRAPSDGGSIASPDGGSLTSPDGASPASPDGGGPTFKFPAEIVAKTRAKYLEAYERLLGHKAPFA